MSLLCSLQFIGRPRMPQTEVLTGRFCQLADRLDLRSKWVTTIDAVFIVHMVYIEIWIICITLPLLEGRLKSQNQSLSNTGRNLRELWAKLLLLLVQYMIFEILLLKSLKLDSALPVWSDTSVEGRMSCGLFLQSWFYAKYFYSLISQRKSA